MSEKVEYFVVNPSVKLFGGVKVTKETEFETWNDDKTVHQTFKNLKLTTKIRKKSEYNGMKMKEESKLEIGVQEGTILGKFIGCVISQIESRWGIETEEVISTESTETSSASPNGGVGLEA